MKNKNKISVLEELDKDSLAGYEEVAKPMRLAAQEAKKEQMLREHIGEIGLFYESDHKEDAIISRLVGIESGGLYGATDGWYYDSFVLLDENDFIAVNGESVKEFINKKENE